MPLPAKHTRYGAGVDLEEDPGMRGASDLERKTTERQFDTPRTAEHKSMSDSLAKFTRRATKGKSCIYLREGDWRKERASYSIDHNHEYLTIVSKAECEIALIHDIFCFGDESQHEFPEELIDALTGREREQLVMIVYDDGANSIKRFCLLMESKAARDEFVTSSRLLIMYADSAKKTRCQLSEFGLLHEASSRSCRNSLKSAKSSMHLEHLDRFQVRRASLVKADNEELGSQSWSSLQAELSQLSQVSQISKTEEFSEKLAVPSLRSATDQKLYVPSAQSAPDERLDVLSVRSATDEKLDVPQPSHNRASHKTVIMCHGDGTFPDAEEMDLEDNQVVEFVKTADVDFERTLPSMVVADAESSKAAASSQDDANSKASADLQASPTTVLPLELSGMERGGTKEDDVFESPISRKDFKKAMKDAAGATDYLSKKSCYRNCCGR